MELKNPSGVTFLNGLHPNQAIYRVFEEERFRQLLFEKQMALVRPALWDDPYENFFHQGAVTLGNGLVSVDGIRDSYYGQCWTLKEESDAIWRIYAPKKDGVRVKTSVQKLADVLYNRAVTQGISQHSHHTCFVGKVRYEPQTRINQIMSNNEARIQAISDSTGKGSAESLLLKRDAFSHEEEVRAIYNKVAEPSRDTIGKILLFDVDPDTFIEEICFDPRFGSEYEVKRTELTTKGIRVPIVQSNLYAPVSPDLLWTLRRSNIA